MLDMCFADSCGAADKIFGQITKAGGRVNVRSLDRPATQNSAEAIHIPRRRALAAEGADAMMNSPLVGPGLNELSNSTIGTKGRRLKPLFNAKRLGLTSEQHTELVDDVECLWSEHMFSKRKWIDQEGDQTLPEMQRMVLEQTIAQGETHTALFWFTNPNRPFPTAAAILDSDRIRTPMDGITQEAREQTVAGQRHADSGRVFSYMVHPYHRNDPRNSKPNDFTEVRKYNEFGREQIVHTYLKKMPGLSRGISHLASCFESMKCFEKYNKVRMEAAIMQTVMAFVIKSNDKNVLNQVMGGQINVDDEMVKKMYALGMKHVLDSQTFHNKNNTNLDGVKALRLLENETAEVLTANQSGINDKQFVDDNLTKIARSVGGMSKATLTQNFESSFSAARGTLISFYRQCENLGTYIVDDWTLSVYANWLEGVILSGALKIPNYPNPFDAWAHFITNREWYCRAEFHGPGRDEIDQAKAMAYWEKRKQLGLMTLEGFYNSKGSDWKVEVRQQIEELKFIDTLLDGLELKNINNPLAYLMTDIATSVNITPSAPDTVIDQISESSE